MYTKPIRTTEAEIKKRSCVSMQMGVSRNTRKLSQLLDQNGQGREHNTLHMPFARQSLSTESSRRHRTRSSTHAKAERV